MARAAGLFGQISCDERVIREEPGPHDRAEISLSEPGRTTYAPASGVKQQPRRANRPADQRSARALHPFHQRTRPSRTRTAPGHDPGRSQGRPLWRRRGRHRTRTRGCPARGQARRPVSSDRDDGATGDATGPCRPSQPPVCSLPPHPATSTGTRGGATSASTASSASPSAIPAHPSPPNSSARSPNHQPPC